MTARRYGRRFGIVGAGTIGSGIARLLSDLDATVVVVAPRPGGVLRAAEMLQLTYKVDVDRGRISAAEAEARLHNIHLTPYYSDLDGVDCVIESVAEDVQTKQEVLAAVEECVSPDCIIASNTSSIPIARIAATADRPDRVIGTHYFWPAHRYRLVEIATAEATSERTLQRTLALTYWQGKVPLIVRDSPGFFTTRILLVYLNEAIALVTEGASIESVDSAMKAFGWPMGPFRLMDAVGIEIFRGVYDAVSKHLGERVEYVQRLWPVLEAGHLGYGRSRREGAKGFYRDSEGRVVDARIDSLIGWNANGTPSLTEVSTRPIWQMINEIGHCLTEGIVSSPEDANLGAVLGIGWPQRPGGPLEYARRVGIDRMVGQLTAWTRQHGPRFAPSPFLTQLASVGAWQSSHVS
jgi:3-hydroxyacyl-CoA dehydrogenase/enoyl-CoA hydratase/3-hydroxybutyryl-CoA epimerase